MKLLWGKMSPFARKVALAAHEVGLADAVELVPTKVDMARANTEVQRSNPLSKVPTLILEDGSALYDSRTICEYLDHVGSGTLFPAPPARWDALRKQSLADGIMDALILWRQERLKEDRQTPAWMQTFADKVDASLQYLDRRAGELGSATVDIGDISIGCALAYLDARFEDLAWRDRVPALARWHADFEARPSAIATHPFKPE